MKKIFPILLAALMALIVLAGCDKAPTKAEEDNMKVQHENSKKADEGG